MANRRLRVIGLTITTAVALLGATACTAGTNSTEAGNSTSPRAQPTTPPSPPAGTKSFADYGFRHGPESFFLPAGLAIGQRVDQPNVVTLFVPADQAAQLADFLDANLTAMGFEIVARTLNLGVPTSLIFTAPGWHGAFTLGQEQAGLTLRRAQGSFSSPS